MKRWIKLLVVIGAGAYLAKRLKPKSKLTSSSVTMQDRSVEKQDLHTTFQNDLSETLIHSFEVQIKALMSTYPSDKTIDLIHRISFNNFEGLHRFIQTHSHLLPEDDVERLEVILIEPMSTHAQTVLDAVVRMAQSAHEHQGTYLNFNVENLR